MVATESSGRNEFCSPELDCREPSMSASNSPAGNQGTRLPPRQPSPAYCTVTAICVVVVMEPLAAVTVIV